MNLRKNALIPAEKFACFARSGFCRETPFLGQAPAKGIFISLFRSQGSFKYKFLPGVRFAGL
jgi:hypothetical protein